LNKPKILFFDIESAGVNALKSDLGFVIMVGYKWANEKEAKIDVIRRHDLRKFDDRELLTRFSKRFEQADICVAHFGSVFDRRFIQGRLLINGLPPIPPTRMRDTCMIARSVANFSSNRLKHLAKILSLDNQKLDNNWPIAWFKVMQGDMEHLRALAEYCKGDVVALEELYNRLLPFDNAHPRIYSSRTVCGRCGANVIYRGKAFVNNNQYRRYQCENGHWGRETTQIKDNNR
jgi:uncharacterized protein YprB with RNaseH-like and TPR domain